MPRSSHDVRYLEVDITTLFQKYFLIILFFSQKIRHKALTKFLFIMLLSCLVPQNPAAAENSPQKTAWLIRWHFDSPGKVKKICGAIDNNFDHLLVQARGRADSWYKSDLAPRAEELNRQPSDFDPLGEILAECGPIPVQAWLNVFYLWSGDTPPKTVIHPAQPENNWILKDNNGKRVCDYSELERKMGWIEGIYADPADPEYRQLMTDVVSELLQRYSLSGIHLDFIRYPGSRYGFGGLAAQKFKKQWGFAPCWLPDKIDPEKLPAWLDGGMSQVERLLVTGNLIWAEMRAGEVTEMVRVIRRVIDKTAPGLILSAAVDPDYLTAYLDKGQDWQLWAGEGLINELYPMTYFGGRDRVERQLTIIRKMPEAKKIKLWAGLGAYIKESEEIGREAAIAQHIGYNGVSLFSLGHLLKKKRGWQQYLQAVNKAVHVTPNQQFRISKKLPQPAEFKLLNLRQTPLAKKHNQALTRLDEFITACNTVIPQALTSLQKAELTIPAWLETRGIFRFVHPLDSLQQQEEQRQLCAKARRLLKKGTDFSAISRRYSQAGTKKMGGRLPRYYLGTNKIIDQLFKLPNNEVSPVIRRTNGYWCYQIRQKGPARPETLENIPWPARRVIFKKVLEKFIDRQIL